jgi:hypothetical protein
LVYGLWLYMCGCVCGWVFIVTVQLLTRWARVPLKEYHVFEFLKPLTLLEHWIIIHTIDNNLFSGIFNCCHCIQVRIIFALSGFVILFVWSRLLKRRHWWHFFCFVILIFLFLHGAHENISLTCCSEAKLRESVFSAFLQLPEASYNLGNWKSIFLEPDWLLWRSLFVSDLPVGSKLNVKFWLAVKRQT